MTSFIATGTPASRPGSSRSEEHTSELQSPCNLVCRLLLEKKKTQRVTVKHARLPPRATTLLGSSPSVSRAPCSRGETPLPTPPNHRNADRHRHARDVHAR